MVHCPFTSLKARILITTGVRGKQMLAALHLILNSGNICKYVNERRDHITRRDGAKSEILRERPGRNFSGHRLDKLRLLGYERSAGYLL